MIEKPKIQYVGQFYVHGSEAPKLEPKKVLRKARTTLPLERLQKIEKIYLDPVAAAAIVVSIVLLVTMVVGALQIYSDWNQYQVATEMLDDLNRQNARLDRRYHASFDLEDIQRKAEALGMVPAEQATHKTITITYPKPEPEVDPFDAWLGEVRWFWNGLWE